MSGGTTSKKHCENARNSDARSDEALGLRLDESLSPGESEKIETLLLAHWGDRSRKPLAADELLEIGKSALEPLFRGPPLGPIPDYLRPHSSVHSCVTEYEEHLEELERWKALKLNSWLRERVGSKYCAGGKVYKLCSEEAGSSSPEKYWFRLIEHQT